MTVKWICAMFISILLLMRLNIIIYAGWPATCGRRPATHLKAHVLEGATKTPNIRSGPTVLEDFSAVTLTMELDINTYILIKIQDKNIVNWKKIQCILHRK